MHNYYIKISHGQFCPRPLQFMKHIQNAVTHAIDTTTLPHLLLLFVCRCLDPSIMLSTDGRAVMYPRLAVTRDLHKASNNNKSRTHYLQAQQMKIKYTMPIPRISFGPQCVIAAVQRDAQTALLSRRNRFCSSQRAFSQQVLSIVLNTSCAWKQSTNNSRNNLCQPTDRNTPCNGNSAVVLSTKVQFSHHFRGAAFIGSGCSFSSSHSVTSG